MSMAIRVVDAMKKFLNKRVVNFKKSPFLFIMEVLKVAIYISISTYLIFCLTFQIFIINKGFISSPKIDKYVEDYYNSYTPYIQFDQDCSEYDPDLYYKMRKGKCQFRKAEFSVTYKNNSLGLRDEKEDLSEVKIITLGDSFTLGYALEQDRTYASFIEKFTGKETLNAGISSYGTAREVMSLNKLLETQRLNNLEYVTIQYCSNDHVENDQYVKGGYKLSVGPEFSEAKKDGLLQFRLDLLTSVNKTAYDDVVTRLDPYGNDWSLKRIFYGNILIILRQLDIVDSPESISMLGDGHVAEESKEYENFLNIIERRVIDNPLFPKNAKIILFNMESFNNKSPFYANIVELLEDDRYAKIKDRIAVVDMHRFLDKQEDFFKIDNHNNAKGSEKIAIKLVEFMK